MGKYQPFPCEGPNKSEMCTAKFRAPAPTECLPVGTLIRAVPPKQLCFKRLLLVFTWNWMRSIPALKLQQYLAALCYLVTAASAVLRATGTFHMDLRD